MEHDAWAGHAASAIAAAGLRAGGARQSVIDHLARQDCCVSAQEIYDGIRADGGHVGVASVYRALDTLASLGLAHRVDLGDGTLRYEPARADGHHHHHLVCGQCGTVEPFEDGALERALHRVAEGHGYAMSAHDVVLHGACARCRAA
ncbi:MAG: Fur family transcriptional regulator [Gaiellales bacterium]